MGNNMKSYFFVFLIFLLLVHKSCAASLPKFLTKAFPDTKPTIKQIERLKEYVDALSNIIEHFPSPPPPPSTLTQRKYPPPPPNAAPAQKKVRGLSSVKEYLGSYGYMTSLNDTDSFNDVVDRETISALNTYQEFFNLNNNNTITQILLPRCGVPDLNFNYNLSHTTDFSWPKGNKWFPNGTKVLTYGFAPASKIPPNMTTVFKAAFQRWSDAIGVLNITEAASFEAADIKVGFYIFPNTTFQELVVGDVVITSEQSGSVVGNMRLDATKYFVVPSEGNWTWENGEFDLETVAMHQIGHLLGLSHSSNNKSIMYPYILPTNQRKVQLTDYDKHNLDPLLYNTTVSACGGSIWNLLLTTLSLGFVLLFY